MRSRPGITLVELLLVLTISGIVLTWAAPRINLSEIQARSVSQQVTTTILAAQQRALTRQHEVRVVFDTVANVMAVHDDPNANGLVDTGEHVRAVELDDVRFTAAGTPGAGAPAVSFAADSSGFPALVFRRSGSGSQSGTIYLGTRGSVTGQRPGDARRLDLDRATGRMTRFHVVGSTWQAHRK